MIIKQLKNTKSRLNIIILIAIFFSSYTYASVAVSGEFIATKECQAYQSKRKKTNPDLTLTKIGKSYTIYEKNRQTNSTWYRIDIEDAKPNRRWVSHKCGTINTYIADMEKCNVAGKEDSYILALSWQPAFCETHMKKPECKVDDINSYQANNFTLHGLWPNKNSCGIKYGFCGEYKDKMRPFSRYSKVPMSGSTLDKLGIFMPSAAHNSYLQRHEWYKHGTCQTKLNADEYYNKSIKLLKEFNKNSMAKLMSDNIGKKITSKIFFINIDKAFGKNAHKRLEIRCKNGNLVDIYINLPKILADKSLKELIQEAKPKFKNGCGNSFFVDAIGQ